MRHIHVVFLLFSFILLAAAVLAPLPVWASSGLAALGFALAVSAVYFGRSSLRAEFRLLADEAERAQNSGTMPPEAPAGETARLAAIISALTQQKNKAESSAAQNAGKLAACQNELAEQTRRAQAYLKEHEKLSASLSGASGRAMKAGAGLASEIRRLSQMVADIGNGLEEQKFSINQTSAAMDQITESIRDVSESVQNASENAQGSRAKAQNGQSEVRGAMQVMDSVKDSIHTLQETMQMLGEQTENIGSVMRVINEVADQTNLLALNAAIEAARAGDAGRGFAVVADEVRKLAEKTMQATSEIGGVVKEIQEAAKSNIQAVGAVTDSIMASAEQLGLAGSLMDEVARGMDQAADELQNISGAVNEQTQSSQDTHEAMRNMKRVISSSAVHMQDFTTRLVSITYALEELDIAGQVLEGADAEEARKQSQLVVWTSDLDTGIELIDSQHKILCYYINALHRASRQNDKQATADIVEYLKLYTATHFSTEEHYFEHSTYPSTEDHKKIHTKFVEKVQQVQRDLQTGRLYVGEELLDFLKDWLLNHIRVTDQQYVSFVLASQGRENAA